MRKLRTQRDNQQWMLDLALNMRGRVQNFERDDLEVPAGKRARNYRMLPKVWREAAERHEALAQARAGARAPTRPRPTTTTTRSRPIAWRSTRSSSTTIRSRSRCTASSHEMVDRRSKVAAYPIERVEVPFDDGKTISCLLHLLPDRRKAPVVIYVPGMDQTKEVFPKAYPQHRALARLSRARHGRPGAGQLQPAEDPRREGQLRARRRRGDQLSHEAARGGREARSRSTASAWAATGRCGSRATTTARRRW